MNRRIFDGRYTGGVTAAFGIDSATKAYVLTSTERIGRAIFPKSRSGVMDNLSSGKLNSEWLVVGGFPPEEPSY